jgi:hypothetical protein
MKPGVYPGMSMASYLAIPALSQGTLQMMLDRCPKAAWFDSYLNPNKPPQEEDEEMDVGKIAHAIVLEGNRDKIAIIDPQEHPAQSTGRIPTGWENKSIRTARDTAREQGLLPILKPRMDLVGGMVTSAQIYIESLRDSEPAIWEAFQPGGGDSEVSMVWDDDGVPCRIRHDRLSLDRKLSVDLKFTGTSAHPDAFGKSQLVRMGYYTGAAFYRRGVNALFDVWPDVIFLVVEMDPPHLCSLVGIEPVAVDLGAEKIDRALKQWRECKERNRWPGYPTRVAYPELPAFEIARWQEEFGGEPGIPYDIAKLWKPERT